MNLEAFIPTGSRRQRRKASDLQAKSNESEEKYGGKARRMKVEKFC